MRKTRAGTLVVTDGQRRLKGLLTERDIRFVDTSQGTVAARMTPVDALIVGRGELSLEVAERIMVERKVKKLPLVTGDGTLIGLVTAKDITRQDRLPFATRDAHGRLRVGAAIGATGDYLERAAELVKAQVDAIVIDIAHGHSVVMARAIEHFRRRFGDFELIAGNVGTGGAVLASVADGIKVGIGPGGGCTRITASACRVQALVDAACRRRSDPDHRRRRHARRFTRPSSSAATPRCWARVDGTLGRPARSSTSRWSSRGRAPSGCCLAARDGLIGAIRTA
jgi:IMP dehydrogenase